MDRIERIRAHVATAHAVSPPTDFFLAPRDSAALSADVYDAVLTPDAVAFVTRVAAQFAPAIDAMLEARAVRRLHSDSPRFLDDTRAFRDDGTWRIDPLPPILRDRRVDIGDVAPCNKSFLLAALNSGAQGVQVDMDDGNCPTWTNTIHGHFHIIQATRGELHDGATNMVEQPALLVVRPRAWNMDETNMVVGGRVVPGAIFDFALHLFHNGRELYRQGRGPFVYLPKLEGYMEAALWRQIFGFAEHALGLPAGCIKATVLIENIYAAFEMDEILFELRHHSAGLNCGMWDYTASIVVNFSERILPDRQRFVSMKSPFLKHYMELLIQTCKKRGAPATTGMVPFVLDQLPVTLSRSDAIAKAMNAKRFEADAGSDGALVYDLALVKPIQEVFTSINTLVTHRPVDERFYEHVLVTLPKGEVSLGSVRLNLTVALSYVLAWFRGHGTVVVNGCVEDSATAEISRAQLWQWIRHAVPVVDSTVSTVTAPLVHDMLLETAHELSLDVPRRHVVAAINLVFRLVTARSPPMFITTFLLEQEPLTKSLVV